MSLLKYFRLKKVNKDTKAKDVKVGLCFGGGGARGFAHLGVIKAFEEYGLDFNVISGCSVGSIVGAMYASGLSYSQMYEIASKLRTKDLKTNKIAFMTSKTEKLENLIESVIPYKNLEDLPKKFYPIAVDLKTGKEICFENGNIAKTVAGSCAVPGVFEPVVYEDYLLADGGLLNNIPADIPKLKGCQYVISVDVHSSRGGGTIKSNVLSVLTASIGIMHKNSCIKGYFNSDVLLAPETQRFKSSKISDSLTNEQMIEEGYKAAIKALPEIQKILKGETEQFEPVADFFEKNTKKSSNDCEI